MQVLDDQKRKKILAAAASCFAAQPFHKVLLSDVAEAAGVGKGTLYIYFKNKDDLYLSVLSCGFSQLIDQLRQKMDRNGHPPLENLASAVEGIVGFACDNPHMYELMRNVTWHQASNNAHWNAKRLELQNLIESIIRQGIDCGDFVDPHPELSARFILNLVRSVMIESAQLADRRTLIDHILHFASSALLART